MLWHWQQACEGVADPAVALTGDLLEASPIRDDDAAALLCDQPLCLEGAQHRTDRGALHPEQLGQIGISLIFILILLFKPTGLFGSKA